MPRAIKLTADTVRELAIAKNLTLTRSDNGRYDLHKGMLYLESFPQLSLCYYWLLEYECVEHLPHRLDLEPTVVIEDFASLAFQQDPPVDVRLNQILEWLFYSITAITELKDNSQLPTESLQQALEYLSLAYAHLKDAAISQDEKKLLNKSIHKSSPGEMSSQAESYLSVALQASSAGKLDASA